MTDIARASRDDVLREMRENARHPEEFREAIALTAARSFGALLGRVENGPRYRFSPDDVRRIDDQFRGLIDAFLEARIEPAIRAVK